MGTNTCPYCGASLKKYWHKITPGLVKVLVKCYMAVITKGKNKFTMKELELNHSEYGNFQKLRFHALIAKNKEDGVVVNKEWIITKRGAEFLKGMIKIPRSVQTFRNRVVDHDTEMVDISKVFKDEMWWQEDFDYKLFSLGEEPKQEGLFV